MGKPPAQCKLCYQDKTGAARKCGWSGVLSKQSVQEALALLGRALAGYLEQIVGQYRCLTWRHHDMVIVNFARIIPPG
jgi:hypothetical protein